MFDINGDIFRCVLHRKKNILYYKLKRGTSFLKFLFFVIRLVCWNHSFTIFPLLSYFSSFTFRLRSHVMPPDGIQS